MDQDYVLDFDKIKHCCQNDLEKFTGIYWDKIPDDRPHKWNCKHRNPKSKHPPIHWINEVIQEHFTQILFILKESFTNENDGFTGWKSFTRKYLFEICEKDYAIYEKEWTPNGKEFIELFPDKINEFLEKYCYTVSPEYKN